MTTRRPPSDERPADALRPVTFRRGFTDAPEGSVLIEQGSTRVLCTASVSEDVPPFRRESGGGWLTAEYAMLPRATGTRSTRESVRGVRGGRTVEISRLVGRSLRAAVDLEALGPYTITLDCDVLQADGGTRCAAVTGAWVALADAVAWMLRKELVPASPLQTQIAAVSVGMVDGAATLDLAYAQDVRAEVDMNVVMTDTGRYVEIQGTAEGKPFTERELGRLRRLAAQGIEELLTLQRGVLGTGHPAVRARRKGR